MSRYIDADAIPYITPLRETIAYKEDIDKMPTIDAVEVVRCKDCKWCLVEDGGCERHGMVLFADEIEHHFCGYGERKEDRP